MRYFAEIYKAYFQANDFFLEKLARARSHKKKSEWGRRRQLNDYSYFVLLFSQLEDHINRECRKLIDKKRASSHWKRNRPWDTIEANRIPFKQRVALLTDKQGGLYASVCTFYKLRCDIAHGDAGPGKAIHIPAVYTEFKQLKKTLRA